MTGTIGLPATSWAIGVPAAGLLFFLIVVGIPVLGLTLIILAAIIRSGHTGRSSAQKASEEARLVQDMHRSLGRLEERIEALETIILVREKGGEGRT